MDNQAKDSAILCKIIAYCDKVHAALERFGNTRETFESDIDYQSCCSMYVFQISEKSITLSESLKSANPHVPWQMIRGMRNILAHNYEALKVDRLWETMQNDLPKLREDCMRILSGLKSYYTLDENDDDFLVDDERYEQP